MRGHFREFFRTSVSVVLTLWELLERDSLLPAKSCPKHLLWALHFLKVYPKQSVDPKTHRKWVWAFIDAIKELMDVVVSIHNVRRPGCGPWQKCRRRFMEFSCSQFLLSVQINSANPGNTFDPCRDLTHPAPPLPQIDFDNRKKFNVLNDYLMTVDGTDFRIPQQGEAKPGNAFASHKYGGKSALRYELGVSILGGDLV